MGMVQIKKPVARRKRSLVWILGIPFALILLMWLVAYGADFLVYRKATRLLREAATLQPGKTTTDQVKNLLERYHGEEYDAHSYYSHQGGNAIYASPDPCLGENLSYAFYESSPRLLWRVIHAVPGLQFIGLHPWYVSLAIHHKEGLVTCYSQRVSFIRRDSQEVEATADLTLRNPQSLVEQMPYEAETFISRNRYHHTRVEVLREASREERDRAFQMNLSCVVSLHGCVLPCEIIPLGWLDSLHERQNHGFELPEGASDPRCPAH